MSESIFIEIVNCIAHVQKTYRSTISGEEKKRIVESKLRLMLGTNDEYNDIKDYIGDIIDVLVFLAKNKKIVKMFKSKCTICF